MLIFIFTVWLSLFVHLILAEHIRTLNVADIVEEDEEVFLSSFRDLVIPKSIDSAAHVDFDEILEVEASGVAEKLKDMCLSAQPMKDDPTDSMFPRKSSVCPNLYPFDQHNWEDDIVWGNSPEASHGCADSRVASEPDVENNDAESDQFLHKNADAAAEKDVYQLKLPLSVEPFDSRNSAISRYSQSCEVNYPQRSNGLESLSKRDLLSSTEAMIENRSEEVCKGGSLGCMNKLSLLNKEFLEGSWLDHILWDADVHIPKPKLILDLQDDQMLFEILDSTVSDHLRSHAGAVVISRSSQSYNEDSLDCHSQGLTSAGRFNISNDKYYSSRKISQQTKSHAKKRTLTSIKVMHSVPALKLQTMKPKLS